MATAAAVNSVYSPLADRMRPTGLDDFIGQSHILGPGCGLRQAIESGNLESFIRDFYMKRAAKGDTAKANM